jgi:hypothetical protein
LKRQDCWAVNRPAATNTARFVFLDERFKRFYLDWDRVSGDTVAILRAEAGRDPGLPDFGASFSSRFHQGKPPNCDLKRMRLAHCIR